MSLRYAFVGLAILTAGATPFAGGAQAQSSDEVTSQMFLRMDRLEAEVRRLTGEVERLNHEITQLEKQERQRAEDVEFRLLELEGIDPTEMQGESFDTGGAGTAGAAAGGAAATDVGDDSDVALAPGSQVLGEIPSDGAGTGGAPATGGDDEAAYQAALASLQRGDSDAAERGFRAFVVDYPDSAYGGEARFWMGEINYARSEYQSAARLYLDVQQNYSSDRKAPDAMLKLGMSLARMGQTDTACLTLREVPLQYPTASPAVLRGAEIEARRLNCGL